MKKGVLFGQDIGYDKPITIYAARHSFATVLKRSGTPMEFISESLGINLSKLLKHTLTVLKIRPEKSLWRI